MVSYAGSKYSVELRWSPEDVRWFASHPALSGCLADGKGIYEALDNLTVARELWIESRREAGILIPEEDAWDTNPITEYWYNNYVNGTHCSLCGNSGVINTCLTSRTAAGVNTGRFNWCMCPNGQARRARSKGELPGGDDVRY